MESLKITGQRPISGEVKISGNKNAVLPMIAALLLTEEECILHNVPDIRDVRSMLEIAGVLGAEFSFENNTLHYRNIINNNIGFKVIYRIFGAKSQAIILRVAIILP